jgi:hypothetical protein
VVWCGLGRGGEVINGGVRDTERGVLYVRIWDRRCVYDGMDVRECIYGGFGAIASNKLSEAGCSIKSLKTLNVFVQSCDCICASHNTTTKLANARLLRNSTHLQAATSPHPLSSLQDAITHNSVTFAEAPTPQRYTPILPPPRIPRLNPTPPLALPQHASTTFIRRPAAMGTHRPQNFAGPYPPPPPRPRRPVGYTHLHLCIFATLTTYRALH